MITEEELNELDDLINGQLPGHRAPSVSRDSAKRLIAEVRRLRIENDQLRVDRATEEAHLRRELIGKEYPGTCVFCDEPFDLYPDRPITIDQLSNWHLHQHCEAGWGKRREERRKKIERGEIQVPAIIPSNIG